MAAYSNKRYFILLALLFCSTNSPIFAEETQPDKFRLAIGGYALTRYDSSMSLTDSGVGAGVSINPQDALGLDSRQTVLRLDGKYRFNEEHAITISWYSVSAENSKVLSEDIQWEDDNGNTITIPTGASVSSSLGYDIYKVGYLWSFYHNDKVELSAGLGLHVTRIAVNLTASTTSSGDNPNDVRSTLPLPVVTFAVDYHVTPRFNWFIQSQFFSMSFDNWSGVYTDAELGMEYRMTKHVGIGVGIGSNSLKVSEETDEYNFNYENRITGALIYLAAYF